jgi:effector-binding domain-containing protein
MSRWSSRWCTLLALLGISAGDAGAAEPAANANPKPWLVSEANLPEGYPAAGPVDEVVIKTYPPHRLARVRSDGGTDGMFWKLFNHIKRNDIAMTAPVEMSWGDNAAPAGIGAKPASEPHAMAFLYREPTLGDAGADPEDGTVMVEDVPELKVVSIGLRGSYGKKTFLQGYEKLTAWLADHPEWQAAGSPRTLGYNSPMVPGFMKFSEVQIPVTPAAAE